MKPKNWRFRLQRTFFGLNDEYLHGVYEEIFLLQYHMGWSFIEAYSLPIQIRRWFLNRLVQQLKEESEAMKKKSPKSPAGGPGRMPPTRK